MNQTIGNGKVNNILERFEAGKKFHNSNPCVVSFPTSKTLTPIVFSLSGAN